jgi:ribulose-bisphosphate carboxylase small chain
MKITQGQFSFLPELSDAEISMQIEYALGQGWSLALEHTDDPHPRNAYWEMWGTPMFDLHDPAGVMMEVKACRDAFPTHYVKVLAFDSSKGFETIRMAFIIQRPEFEPGFELIRAEGPGRTLQYTLRSYATHVPPGQRYLPTAGQP